MKLKDVLKRPIITEKSMKEAAFNQYTFAVATLATKIEIGQAVRQFFGVEPISIKIINVKGRLLGKSRIRKKIRSANWKKAIVSLKAGQKIDAFEVGE